MAVFMLHQATEQVLRSIILAITRQDVRSHTISELKQHLKICTPHLQNFLFNKDQTLLTILESSYSGSRYLNNYRIEKENAESILREVKIFMDEVKKSFEEMISSFLSITIFQNKEDEAF